jgi:hypothetical protein
VLAKLHALHQAEVELETAVEKHANAKKMYESAFGVNERGAKVGG